MSITPAFLAIDQGSHASRAAVYDSRGQRGEIVYRAVATECPRPGWVEQDAEELLESVQECVTQATRGVGSTALRAGLATQRSSIVCWDRESGAALSSVLSWRDRRAADWLEKFRGREEDIGERTGLPLSAHYGASKIAWCLANLDRVRGAHDRLVIGPLASFLAHRLCPGTVPVSDPANASRTLLFNRHTLDWDDQLLGLFGIDRAILPLCVPTRHSYGAMQAAAQTIPLALVTGDQAAALFAGAETGSGNAFVNLGTGAFLQIATGAEALRVEGLLTSIAYADEEGPRYVLEGTVNGAGNALTQMAGELGFDAADYAVQLDGWIDSVREPPLFLNGIGGLGSPWWQAEFDSRFIGAGEARARMVAVAESILFLLQANLDRARIALAPTRIRVGGGIARSDSLCQRLADLSQLPVWRQGETESTLAGVACLLGSKPAPSAGDRCFEPAGNRPVQQRYRRWLIELEQALEAKSEPR